MHEDTIFAKYDEWFARPLGGSVTMTINAMLGTTGRIGITWDYWLCSIPIVAVGAPLGAWAASKVDRDVIIRFLLVLIGIALASTLVLVHFDAGAWLLVFVSVILCSLWFGATLRYRRRAQLVD